ncbi:hypothetical protein COB72_01005 [bacterium]|nr:MAG: hypothetical protein COB72_01005 [bacterium]
MMIVNRFVGIAEKFPDKSIPLDKVFIDARQEESDDIVEAMYVIANRRLNAGHPIEINELTDSIPFIVEDDAVRDAAIEISIRGLTASGVSHEKALETILEATSPSIPESKVIESEKVSAILRETITGIQQNDIQLPAQFGRDGYDGQARYELRRILGSGNQGTVYEATDRVFQEEGLPSLVALKIFHSDSDPDRSKKEGARARRVRHKNLARVIDQGESEDGKSYVTYELIEGQPLDAWVKQRRTPLTTQQTCKIVIDLARGVQSAHTAGVIHRDIKPTNILMNRDDEPVITDFGIAHAVSSDPRLCSHYGTRGSLAFMAPEQFDQTSDGSMPSVDVYALGGILYWLTTGKFPNGDTVAEAMTWLEERNEGGPRRIHDWTIDGRLQSIIYRALAVESSQRYQSPEMIAQDLEDYLAFRSLPWLDRSVVVKTQLFTRRNPLVVGLLVLIVLSVGIGVGGSVSSRANIRYERAQAEAALSIEQLNGKIILEQDRVRQVQDKATLVRVFMKAWSDSIKTGKDESLTASSLFFLHMVSTSGILDNDPEYAEKIFNQRIEVAEEYLASIDVQQSSPIQLAFWHEMLGMWYQGEDILKSKSHLLVASALLEEYAPADTIWRDRLAEAISKAE